MALTSFANRVYTIHHTVDYPAIVCVEQYDTMEIILQTDPVNGTTIAELKLTNPTNPVSEYVDVWKNATNVAYDATHDQITGSIVTKGAFDPAIGRHKSLDRAFCMSLSGEPAQRESRLNCYVSEPLSGASTDPDDGSWAGDVD